MYMQCRNMFYSCALCVLLSSVPPIYSRNTAINVLFATASPTFSTDSRASRLKSSTVNFSQEPSHPLLNNRGGSLAAPEIGSRAPPETSSNHTDDATPISLPHSNESLISQHKVLQNTDEECSTVTEEETSATETPEETISSFSGASSSNGSVDVAVDTVQEETKEISVNDDVDTLKNDEKKGGPLKVLFLSADTGGGHRASAESLANQFLRHYPGSEYNLLDVWTPTEVYPYRTLVKSYQHLSAHPRQWKALYHISNSRPYEIFTDWHSRRTCEMKIKREMEAYDPDVIISVHPTMNNVPLRVTRKLAEEREKYIPFFTVVTDFGSAHCTWFHKGVDKMYIASKRIRKLAKKRGSVSDEKLVMSGLPIRHDFAVQAENMGERFSQQGIEYRAMMKERLGLDPNKKMILLMGGGEGVGSLASITKSMYKEFKKQGVDASICVVCGRNQALKTELETKNWEDTDNNEKSSVKQKIRNILRWKKGRKNIKKDEKQGNIDVVGLGFVSNMAEYMTAADVLVSKAGPGTIAEAAALGLPIMITSFLPGQEAGNVDIVLDGGFGEFNKKPRLIAKIVTKWAKNDSLIKQMSKKSAQVGNPIAASEIVKDIGSISHDWIKKNKSS